MSLTEPTLADPITPSDAWRQAAARETPFGQYLGEKLLGGLEGMRPFSALEEAMLPGRLHGDMSTVIGGGTDEFGRQSPGMGVVGPGEGAAMMPKAEWEASPSYRPSLTWDEGMTPARAEALATQHDRLEWNNSLVARYQGGFMGEAAGFVAGLAPGIADPTNYVPLLGPAAKAAMVARLGVIGGNVALHGAEAAANSALFEPLTASHAATFGQPYGWEDAAADIALGALAGSVGGAIHGGLEYRGSLREAATRTRLDQVMAAADATSLAAEQIDRGEAVNVAPVMEGRLPEAPRPTEPTVAGTVRDDAAAPWRMTRDEFLAGRPRGGQAEDVSPKFSLGDTPEHGPPGMAVVEHEGSSIRHLVSRDAEGKIDGFVAYNWDAGKNELYLEGLQREGATPAQLREEAGTLTTWVRPDQRGTGLAARMYDDLQRRGVNIDAASGLVTTEAGAKFAHRRAVERAFVSGKDVPGRVLADYPGLAPRPTPSFATATPEEPHPSVAEAAKRVGKAADPLATFKADAQLEGYEQPLPGHEPKPEPGTPEADRAAKPQPPPTREEKAATLAALPPELAEIEAMKREGSFTPGDEATLAAGEAEAQRAENYATAWQTLASCVLRNAA